MVPVCAGLILAYDEFFPYLHSSYYFGYTRLPYALDKFAELTPWIVALIAWQSLNRERTTERAQAIWLSPTRAAEYFQMKFWPMAIACAAVVLLAEGLYEFRLESETRIEYPELEHSLKAALFDVLIIPGLSALNHAIAIPMYLTTYLIAAPRNRLAITRVIVPCAAFIALETLTFYLALYLQIITYVHFDWRIGVIWRFIQVLLFLILSLLCFAYVRPRFNRIWLEPEEKP